MGFYSTTLEPKTAPRKTPSCAQKTASREIFSSNRKVTYEIERNPLKLQQEKLQTTYKTASGRSSWPSRDPIEEEGGINLYSFAEKDPINRWDKLGLAADTLKPWEPRYGSGKEATAAGSMYALNGAIRNYALQVKNFKNKKRKKRPAMLEFCGNVCCKKGTNKFYFAQARKGGISSCLVNIAPKCKKGDVKVGVYHNHPTPKSGIGDDHTRFSGKDGDKGYSEKNNIPIGVGYEYKGPKYIKIYDPETNKVEKWKPNKKGGYEKIPD